MNNAIYITFDIHLTTPRDVTAFTEAATSVSGIYDICASHGTYTVDARSIMGMYSLNLTQDITITISLRKYASADNTDALKQEMNNVAAKFKEWKV